MKKNKLKNKNTIYLKYFIVFFLVIVSSIWLFNIYGRKTTTYTKELVNEKIDKVLYQFFNRLINNDIINKENINNILEITKNNRGEILTVNYDLEKTYKILTDISLLLTESIDDLEHGKIDIPLNDKYLKQSDDGLVLFIPLFLSSENTFLNNIGPRIPILINFNENILTNIKTSVKNYGFNNALLEIYVTVEMQKLIISPFKKEEVKFNYDILVAALVVNGSVPNFYGGNYDAYSSILSSNDV